MRAITDPFEFEHYRKAKIKERLEKESSNRIAVKRRLPTVNATIASTTKPAKWMNDPRFKEMFENPDFQVDENDPRVARIAKQDKQPIEEHFVKVESESDSEGSSSADEMLLSGSRHKKAKEETTDDHQKVGFYEIKEGHEDAVEHPEKIKEHQVSFAKRLAAVEAEGEEGRGRVTRNAMGQMQMTFISSKTKQQLAPKKPHGKDEWVARLPMRRSARSHLKPVRLPKKNFH